MGHGSQGSARGSFAARELRQQGLNADNALVTQRLEQPLRPLIPLGLAANNIEVAGDVADI